MRRLLIAFVALATGFIALAAVATAQQPDTPSAGQEQAGTAAVPDFPGDLTVGGEVGIGTEFPSQRIDIVDNSPAIQFDATGSAGFGWFLTADAAAFVMRQGFVNEADNVIALRENGDVGIGTTTPAAQLHVDSSDAELLVTNTNAAAASQTLLTLENNGAPLMFYRDASSDNPGWQESLFRNDSFGISRLGTGGAEFQVFPTGKVEMGPGPNTVFRLLPSGNLTIAGTLTQSSDRTAKIHVEPVDAGAILERLAVLELSTWSYRHTPGVRHLGPTAQDFAAAFGLGGSNTGIAAVDADGVALAAIQALAAQNQDLADENRELQAELDTLTVRVALLETGQAPGNEPAEH